MALSLERLEQLRAAVESASAPQLVACVDGTILSANAAFEQLFGYPGEELVSRPIDVLFPPGVGSAVREILTRTDSEAAAVAKRELLGRHSDGGLLAVEVHVESASEGLALIAVADLTDRLRFEAPGHTMLKEHLAFLQLLSDFSYKCINLPASEVPAAIRTVLGVLGERLDLDRCSFFKIAPDQTLVDPVIWTAPGVAGVQAPVAAASRFPETLRQVLASRTVVFSDRDELDEPERGSFAAIGTRAAVYIPLTVDGRVSGSLGFVSVTAPRQWPPVLVQRLEATANVFGQALARIQRDEALARALAEVQRLKEQLEAENVYLRRAGRQLSGAARVIGQSPAVQRVIDQVRQVAATDSTVLLLGETGTGKELFASEIHELSARRGGTMVRVNCGAIPATLIESELFGREKGAFTGALARQVGRFELADRSTIFLDEIGDLPHEVQVKLLRVLEERTIERLGSSRSIAVDTRIIAATHRNLEQRVQEGFFREDLYYRLNVFPIHVPPLRQRTDDVPALVWHMVEEFSRTFGKCIDAIDQDSLAALQQYDWPGNVRELRNLVERAMIVATSRRLTIPLPQASPAAPRRSTKLVEVERAHIRSVLESTRWRIRGAGGAAERLALKPTTLETRMTKLGIRRPKDG